MVSGNILVTIRVDVAHLATGVADGLGVGLGLPTRVTAALLSKARSQDARGVRTGLIARVVVGPRVSLILVSVVPVIVAQGTVVGVGIAGIAIRVVLFRRVLIPTVLAKDIHGLVDSIGVLFLAQGTLGPQGSQEGATLGFGDRPEEEAGLKFGSSLSFDIQLGLAVSPLVCND